MENKNKNNYSQGLSWPIVCVELPVFIFDLGLSPNDFQVYSRMKYLLQCFPEQLPMSMYELSCFCRVSETNFKQCIKRLIVLNLIERSDFKNPDGGRTKPMFSIINIDKENENCWNSIINQKNFEEFCKDNKGN